MTDQLPSAPGSTPDPGPAPDSDRIDPESIRRGIGWTLLLGAIIGTVTLGMQPTPYVIERPGPVFDTLGEVQAGGEAVPLISIDGAESHPTEGALNLLTVTIDGSRERPVNWIDIASAWFSASESIVPVDAVYPEGQTDEEADERSAVEMQNSQQEAIAAALTEAGMEYSGVVSIVDVVEGEPAEGVLEAGDEVLAVNGEPVAEVSALQDALASHGTEAPAELLIRRDGEELTVEVTPRDNEGTPMIGVLVSAAYDFPIDVTIQLENVGGPSAGMMFALGVYDKLTPGALTGGEIFAGTGTIEADGTIGAIGGIRQKMHGAEDAGADWFLAPAANCDEVAGNVPAGLRAFAVETLDDALAVLEAVRDGGDLDALPTCSP